MDVGVESPVVLTLLLTVYLVLSSFPNPFYNPFPQNLADVWKWLGDALETENQESVL